MATSLNTDIAAAYYQTTAGRAHSPTHEYYERCANGLLRWLRDWLPTDKNAQCVDLACGCGEMQYLLEREGFAHTIGIDLCLEELDQARNFVGGKLVHEDILTFLRHQPSDSVDFISALNILEHLEKDELYAVLKEAKRTLRPGGSLVAIVPNAVSPFGALTRHWDITHEWAFTTNSVRQLSAIIRFDEVEFRECGPVAHGLVSLVRVALWRILRLFITARLMIELASSKDGIYTMDMVIRLGRAATPKTTIR